MEEQKPQHCGDDGRQQGKPESDHDEDDDDDDDVLPC